MGMEKDTFDFDLPEVEATVTNKPRVQTVGNVCVACEGQYVVGSNQKVPRWGCSGFVYPITSTSLRSAQT